MDLKFISKSCNDFDSNYIGRYNKPATCPHCGFGTDATFLNKTVFDFESKFLLLATCKCTSCQKTFFFLCEREPKGDGKFIYMHPSISFSPFKSNILEKISPRFIEMYNQSLQAEFAKSYDLAAIGFRTSLEILIKDFAITELYIPEDEAAKKTLCDAISSYLGQTDLLKTADVVRILGNDHTHYKRKYPQHDFDLLKGYMDIFLKQIKVQYMIKHPPVSRSQ